MIAAKKNRNSHRTCRNVGIPRLVRLMLLILLVPRIGGSIAGVFGAGPDPHPANPAATLRPDESGCRKLELRGEVAAGQEWQAPIGEGWLFRVLPIAPSGKGYTGWDLVVDRADARDAGYPDALLLATPPYGSLNEREIGTTFGLRAQDAIAWGPRRFHFFTGLKDLRRGRELYKAVTTQSVAGMVHDQTDKTNEREAESELLKMVGGGVRLAAGEFTVQEARLAAGIADPPPYARQWAEHPSQARQTLLQSAANPSALGELRWIGFSGTLWLPEQWKFPKGVKFTAAKCSE
jgi:hypothetical protein